MGPRTMWEETEANEDAAKQDEVIPAEDNHPAFSFALLFFGIFALFGLGFLLGISLNEN